ncbi:serine/threonine protein kinase [Streptomyces laurentii]|uniref:serine/threonine protein kinase n=1 Tax=Streptomyces laurentii TaxID=39478 RepID=UPI0036C541AB
MTAGFPLSVEPGYRVGRWVVEGPLGAGAFASVYAARRAEGTEETETEEREPWHSGEGPGDEVALKFLPTGTCTPRGLRHLKDLVEREVELLSRLRAPRLIRLYETLTVDDPANPELDGATVLVLERADRSLQSLLRSSDTEAGTVPEAGPALLAQVCEGLHQLHGAGWVHGDLKPGNVLLMPDGGVRLGDFSTAGEMEGTHAYGPGFATPDYTPPELLWPEMGARGTRVRPSSDIWAFGVLAHLVLTGTHPFPGGTPAARRDASVRYARGVEDLRLSLVLPDPWRAIVEDCLRGTHEERAALDAATLLHRVQEAARGETPSRGRWAAARRRTHRLRILTRITAALVTTGLTVAGLAWSEGEAEAAGYDRCAPSYVCVFSERDGQGEMCAWVNDDSEWSGGDAICAWAKDHPPVSIFNNGVPDPREFIHVDLFASTDFRDRLGCVRKGQRANVPLLTRTVSHRWAKRC